MQHVKGNTKRRQAIDRAMVTAQERERSRIAAELHDNVNQLLVTAKLEIGLAKSDMGCREKALKKAELHLSQAIEAIKGVTRRLSGSVVLHDGLEKCIAEVVASVSALHVDVRVDIASALVGRLTTEQQLMVYRMVQEQSGNILKYAQASNAIISLKQNGNQVELIIMDDGKGFDREKLKPGGIGFINIFNRAAAFGGTVEITSSNGNGCTLKVIFPLEEEIKG